MNKGKQIIYTAEQLIGKGNLDIINTAFTTGYIAHAENKEHKGQEFIKRFSKLLRTAIPDIQLLNIQIFIEDKNTVSWQRTLQGTHTKDMMGIPPSNKTITWNEMISSRFEGAKIAEEWIVSELAGQLLLKLPQTK